MDNGTRPTEAEWGLAALGRSGDVSIAVDQAISGPDRWEMEVELPRFYLRFAIPAPTVIAQFGNFLQCQSKHSTTAEMVLGTVGDANVSIIKDDEFVDRFILCVLAHNGAVRYTLSGDVVTDFVAALEQAQSDLDK